MFVQIKCVRNLTQVMIIKLIILYLYVITVIITMHVICQSRFNNNQKSLKKWDNSCAKQKTNYKTNCNRK